MNNINNIIVGLKSHIEEAKKFEQDRISQFQENKEICQKQELGILSLKEYLNKKTAQFKTNDQERNGGLNMTTMLIITSTTIMGTWQEIVEV